MMLLLHAFWLIAAVVFGQSIEEHQRPIIQDVTVSKNKNLEQVRLNCDLEQGLAPLQFEWYLNNEKLEENNRTTIKIRDDSSVLIIKSLSVDDLGDYKCIARNLYGEDARTASLYVNIKPTWSKEPKDITSSFFKEIVLDCKAKGHLTPTTKWSKLNENRKNAIKNYETETVKFNFTSKEDAGYYECRSENAAGSIEKTILVGYFGKSMIKLINR